VVEDDILGDMLVRVLRPRREDLTGRLPGGLLVGEVGDGALEPLAGGGEGTPPCSPTSDPPLRLFARQGLVRTRPGLAGDASCVDRSGTANLCEPVKRLSTLLVLATPTASVFQSLVDCR
jgi:hypothetical protein